MSQASIVIPRSVREQVIKKYGEGPLDDPDSRYAVTLYVLHLAAAVYERVRPAKRHKARLKRLYNTRDTLHFDVARRWSALHGFDYDHTNLITGAWEIKMFGQGEGYFTDTFLAKDDDFRTFLLEMADTGICPSGAMEDLILAADENWELMDVYNDAIHACIAQLDF